MILVDRPLWRAHGRRFAHLVSDDSYDELHAFAAGLGLPDRAFHRDHYDLPEELWEGAVAAGATPVDGRVMLLIVNRYLTLDADLLYTAGTSSWRLDTRRRMRRDELHHLDSARLGILARVTKANGS